MLSIMPRFRSNETANPADLRVSTAPLRQVLAKQTKAALVDLIVEIAQENVRILRQLELRFEPKTSPDELVAATRLAITDATDFDEREINRNFRYDYQAYSTVKHNFVRLIDLGHLHDAMNLSLNLM